MFVYNVFFMFALVINLFCKIYPAVKQGSGNLEIFFCDQVMEQECAKHAILNRIQHQFICDRIKRTVDGYASLSNERGESYTA